MKTREAWKLVMEALRAGSTMKTLGDALDASRLAGKALAVWASREPLAEDAELQEVCMVPPINDEKPGYLLRRIDRYLFAAPLGEPAGETFGTSSPGGETSKNPTHPRCAEWCGTTWDQHEVHPDGGNFTRDGDWKLNLPRRCFCTAACRDAGHPLHPHRDPGKESRAAEVAGRVDARAGSTPDSLAPGEVPPTGPIAHRDPEPGR